jgi:DNA-binding NtrC family response regulator
VQRDQQNSSVLLATDNAQLIKDLSMLLSEHHYELLIENSSIKSLLKILEIEISFVMIDLDSYGKPCIDFISVIKKMRPGVPIVSISSDMSIETVKQLAQLGIFYCATSPIHAEEIYQLLNALDRYKVKNEYY